MLIVFPSATHNRDRVSSHTYACADWSGTTIGVAAEAGSPNENAAWNDATKNISMIFPLTAFRMAQPMFTVYVEAGKEHQDLRCRHLGICPTVEPEASGGCQQPE